MEFASPLNKIGFKEHNGINIPLFSIYSKDSCGIGEYLDLIPLIHFCKQVSFDIIQLLPLNDTGHETSPYSAISAFALNPIHLSLSKLIDTNESLEFEPLLKELKKLNQLPRVDYKNVHHLKDQFLRKYYQLKSHEIIELEDYQNFKNENPWLTSYALFKTLRILQNFKSFEEFSIEWQTPTHLTFTKLANEHQKEINYHIFVQYLCFKQFESVKKVAQENHVFLMGDIPILINRDSADVWIERPLFNLDFVAGAPPDMYSKEGQKWGFPIYNWSEMEKENYEWWKLRLKVASRLYDIYRIDHIVGFFRIFAIPNHLKAINGHYIPQNETEALIQGDKILNMMLKASSMLPIGEDLGNVPDHVRECMQKLGIPGTKVMRWERVWKEDGRYIDPLNYPKLSLTTVSTHDSEPLALWWKNQSEEASIYAKSKNFEYNNHITAPQFLEILKESYHTSSLFHVNLLQELLYLIKGFTSDNLEHERINIPGVVSDENWTYRFQKPIEEIVTSRELITLIEYLLK